MTNFSWKNCLRSYLLPVLLVYALALAFYVALNIGVPDSYIYNQARRYLPAALAFCLPFFCIRGLKVKQVLGKLTLALAYIVLARVLCFLTAKTDGLEGVYLELRYEIVFGLYLFPVLVLGQYFLGKFCRAKTSAITSSVIEFFLAFPLCLELIYYIKFQHAITHNAIMVIYQTDYREALEYLASLGCVYLLPSLCLMLLIMLFFYRQNFHLANFFNGLKFCEEERFKSLSLAAATVGLAVYAFVSLFPRLYFNQAVADVYNYYQAAALFKTGRTATLQNLSVKSHSQKNGTILLVIGESASRDYMSAFTNLKVDSTPWLKKQHASSNFLLFPNAYACSWYTVSVLEHALTESSFYNNIPFNKAVSFIDIAKKAGYKVSWLSSQGRVGVNDTPATLVAETADLMLFNKSRFDEGLLPLLTQINSHEKNLIVLHLIGSHSEYYLRYPPKFQKWNDPGSKGRVADYENSLLYTDYLLEKVFNYACANWQLDAMVYFSDHAAVPTKQRDPDNNNFAVMRIPLFVYLSDTYRAQAPPIYENLRRNQNAYWSDDLIYDLLCGLMQIESNHFDERNSLTSSRYQFNKNNVKVAKGRRWAKDDVFNKNNN